jgi:hypothetical protein
MNFEWINRFLVWDAKMSPESQIFMSRLSRAPIETKLTALILSMYFVATENIRHIMNLLGEAQDGGMPFHYRYLSIYKAFEAEFKPTGKWIELDDVFSEIKEQYEAKRAVKRSLVNRFHELRDRCAHVLKGGKLGLLGLPDRDGQDVELLLPLLVAALAVHVNRKYPAIRLALRDASLGRI